jgi:hypothetical protein
LEQILLRATRFEEQGTEGRGQCERIECGDRGRDRNGQRELAKKCAGNSGDERGRNKYRAKYQRDRNQGSTNFGHRLARCVARTQTIFNVMLDCLDNHYGVVNHDPDR